MFKNYLKTAIRNLLRYKGFALVNILGLSIGLTGCLVIGLFVWDELQYDKFIPGGEQIFRTYITSTNGDNTTTSANVPPMFATHLKQQYPEVESTMRILLSSGKMLVEHDNFKAFEDKWMFVDSTFFQMFPLKFIAGDPGTVLNDPTSVVITASMAKKNFGKADAIGKTLKIEKTDYVVRGVLADVPDHFHLSFNLLFPLRSAGIAPERYQKWSWQQFYTYVKVRPGTDIQQLQEKFQQDLNRIAKTVGEKDAFTYLAYFQPLKDIHLKSSQFYYDNAKRGNYTYVKGLSIIALFVLIIACFNFINLATARSVRRAKEIGVRKVIGAERKQLMFQFTAETILLALVSIVVAAIVGMLLLPSLNHFTEKNISFNPISNPLIAFGLLGAGVIVGILAGIYPALVLSGFQPIKVLKGMKTTGDRHGYAGLLRQGLVVIQFALSALLIVSSTIVYRQIKFLHESDMGFNKDQLLYFPVRGGEVAKNPEAFKEELKRNSNIVSVTGGYGLPGDQYAGDGIIVPGKTGDQRMGATQFMVDYDYVKTLGLKVIAGRDFSRDMATDSTDAFIISETAVKELGFGTPEKALGQRLNWEKWIPDSLNPVKKGKVIGVIKDFHYTSMHDKLGTVVLQIYPPILEKIAVKVKGADMANTIAYIEKVWNKFSPDYPLDYKFLDENFAAMYKAEDKLGTLLLIFTVMAIFVGCMGLFGLAAFTAEQRNKEISIRKVLGASMSSIVTMLSKAFLRPVFIASIIAFPIAWYGMNKWLENFQYRVSISWWVFAIAAIAALVIALVTVSFQAIKAAVANPVKSLRSE